MRGRSPNGPLAETGASTAGSGASAPLPVNLRALSVAVVLPQYNPKLTTGEAICVRHLHRHLGSYDRFVVAPESLEKTLPGFEVIRFPDHFFTSAGAFAILQLRARFYRAFAAHEHVLMVQLDPLVLSKLTACSSSAPVPTTMSARPGSSGQPSATASSRSDASRRSCACSSRSATHSAGPTGAGAIGPRSPGTARYRRGACLRVRRGCAAAPGELPPFRASRHRISR
jgi:hypothetical protein